MSEDISVKIGLEIHVPLKTRQKLFCYCPINYWEAGEANVNTCPVCTGMPGAKPYPLNEEAIETAVMVAELLDCEVVSKENVFVKRKHYNYPDLPSGYQRTSEPFGRNGSLSGVGIWEVHLEEDPGRYDLESGFVDYNRSGVALIEIVTAPDMVSAEGARKFLRELTNLLKYTERVVEVGGVMRADVNISIEGGAKVEIKNINSVKGAFKAIQYEVLRQKQLMRRGVKVTQETRGFNEKSLITTAQRVKETADDYRYIPDPDIPPQKFSDDYVSAIKLPETPGSRRKRLVESFKIRDDYAKVLVSDKDIADLFEHVAPKTSPDAAANWIVREVLRQLNYRSMELSETKLSPAIIIELLSLVSSGEVTDNVGKKLLERVIDSGESPKKIVEDEGLIKKIEVEDITRTIMAEHIQPVFDYLGGEKNSRNYLMGQVMKATHGTAAPEQVIITLEDTLADYEASTYPKTHEGFREYLKKYEK
ncbi:MAG: Asp-tRNA(Asn)/Glu-tRNA(Gln) amidotransferase subunit GatB [Candidatus Altiarchaeota archaeon]